MREYINNWIVCPLKTETIKQSFVTFSFTVVNGMLGLLFYLFLARVMRASDFGLFSLSITILALFADVGNFGVNTGIVYFVSKYIGTDIEKAKSYLKIAFLFKAFAAIVFLIVGYFISPSISRQLFYKAELITPLRIVFLGIGTTWMFSFTTSYYQSTQKFISWGSLQVITNSLRLTAVFVFFYLSKLNLNLSLIFYILAPFIGFILGFINIPFDFIKNNINKKQTKEFFSYNIWVAIFSAIAAFSSRTDTFLLGRLETTYNLGLYAAAYQLVQVIPQLIGAIGTVVAPKLSSFPNRSVMLAYFKKLQVFVIGISLLIILFIPFSKYLISVFLGTEYLQSYPIFLILLLSMLVFLISVPVHNAIIYYFSYPKLFTKLSILNLLLVFPLSYFLTARYGVFTTAYAVLTGNIINFIIPLLWFLTKVRKV